MKHFGCSPVYYPITGKRRYFMTRWLCFFSVFTSFLAAQTPSDQALDQMLERAFSSGAVPGMSVAVVQGDHVVYARGFGVTDVFRNNPVKPETPFYIASTTKSLTALAVLIGASQGKWEMDVPISNYLGRFSDSVDVDHITVRELINHAHGIENDDALTMRTAYSGEINPAGLERALTVLRSSVKPKTFDYTNTGYVLAGMIMEKATGHSWKEFVSDNVLNPAGMQRTKSSMRGVDIDALAQPHLIDTVGFRLLPYGKTDVTMHAAGGHISTAPDLARLIVAQLNQGRIDGKQVFPEKLIAESHRMQISQDKKFGSIQRFGWSPGWDIGIVNGDTLYHRFGSYAGFMSHVSFMPTHHLGVVILVNEAAMGSRLTDVVASYLYDAYLGKPEVDKTYSKQFANLSKMVAMVHEKIGEEYRKRLSRVAPLPHSMEAYTGTFINDAMGAMTWRVLDGSLWVTMGIAKSRAEIYNAAENKWRVEVTGRGEVMTFLFDGDLSTGVEYGGYLFQRN